MTYPWIRMALRAWSGVSNPRSCGALRLKLHAKTCISTETAINDAMSQLCGPGVAYQPIAYNALLSDLNLAASGCVTWITFLLDLTLDADSRRTRDESYIPCALFVLRPFGQYLVLIGTTLCVRCGFYPTLIGPTIALTQHQN